MKNVLCGFLKKRSDFRRKEKWGLRSSAVVFRKEEFRIIYIEKGKGL